MDELAKMVIGGAPNLAVALWALFWSFRSLERKQEAYERLTERLLAVVEEREQLKAQLNGKPNP